MNAMEISKKEIKYNRLTESEMNILYSHYQETNTLNSDAKKRRDKEFVLLCIIEALSFLVLVKPTEVYEGLLKSVEISYGISINIGINIIHTLIWILMVYMTIKYVQDMLSVERNYRYLEKLEKEIKLKSDIEVFEREGDDYKNEYPMVLNFIDLFYKMLCPLLFMAINIIHIVKEWKFAEQTRITLVLDTVFFVSISIILWFYFFEIHIKITEWFKKCKLINYMAGKLRKILKEV